MIQISGSGLVAPCGMLFNEKYKKFHIGNIVKKNLKTLLTPRNIGMLWITVIPNLMLRKCVALYVYNTR